MRDVTISSDESVSFEITSLFTNVPIKEAVETIHDKLRIWLREHHSPDRIAELLGLCLKSTYLSYGGELYKLREGAAMGFPASAVIAHTKNFLRSWLSSQTPFVEMVCG